MAESINRTQKLKGAKNMMRWQEDMKAIYVVEDMWRVVIGTSLDPIAPTSPLRIESTMTPEETKEYKVQYKEWENKHKSWQRTNDRAMALMILLVEDGPRAHVVDMGLVHEAWLKLKQLYGTSDLATRDQALFEISRIDLEDFKSIAEYSKHINKHAKTLIDLEVGLPKWMLSTFFWLGLKKYLDPYVFQMIQAARAANQELDIDDITVLLVQHDKRISQSEDSRAIPARFGKQTKPKKSKGIGREDSKDRRSRCDHCDSGLHKKCKCFYLIPDIRPRDWKPADGKEQLSIEAIRKKKKASDTKHSDSSDSSSEEEEAKKSTRKIKTLKSY